MCVCVLLIETMFCLKSVSLEKLYQLLCCCLFLYLSVCLSVSAFPLPLSYFFLTNSLSLSYYYFFCSFFPPPKLFLSTLHRLPIFLSTYIYTQTYKHRMLEAIVRLDASMKPHVEKLRELWQAARGYMQMVRAIRECGNV
jgi:hypothetical protein